MLESLLKALFASAMTVLILSGSAPAEEVDAVCERYDGFSFKEVNEGNDPWARLCVLYDDAQGSDPRVANIDRKELLLARIKSKYEFGNDEDVLVMAQEWARLYPAASDDLKAKVNAYLARSALELGDAQVAKAAIEKVLEYAARSDAPPDNYVLHYRRAQSAVAGAARTKVIGAGGLIDAATSSRGDTEISLTISDVTVSALVDTGAEISVISEQLAKHLGFRMIPDTKVLTQYPLFGDFFYSRLAFAPPIYLGGMSVENALFLVIDPDEARLQSNEIILGLSFLKVFQRVAFLNHGSQIAFGGNAPAIECIGGTGRLFRNKDGIGLSVLLGGQIAPAHHDSGLTGVYVYEDPVRFYAPKLRFRRFHTNVPRIDNAPPIIGIFRSLPFEMDAARLTAHRVPVFKAGKRGPPLEIPLVVGGWATKKLDLLVFDFKRMKYAAETDLTPTAKQCVSAARGRG